MINRMVRASQLDSAVYEEVERDIDATTQAAIVVAIVAVSTGIGQLRDNGILGLVLGIVGGLVGWVVWAAITYFVGKTIFKTANTRVTMGEMLRTLGFARSPGVLNFLGVIPVLGVIVLLITGIWTLITGVIAIRQAMDFSTGRAIGTAIIGWIISAIITGIFLGIAGAAS